MYKSVYSLLTFAHFTNFLISLLSMVSKYLIDWNSDWLSNELFKPISEQVQPVDYGKITQKNDLLA